jgi:hypothetical protein
MRLASAFTLLPAYLTNARDDAGFFDGYDNPSACIVVLFSALIGLAISTACKYADAVVKTFATAAVTVDLVILSSLYGLDGRAWNPGGKSDSIWCPVFQLLAVG